MKNFIRSWVTLLLVMIVCMGYTQNPVTVTKNISGGYTVSFSGKTETVPGLFYNTNGTTSINLYTSTNLPRPVLSRPLFPILSITPSNWVINGHNGYTTVNQVTAALDSLIIPSSFTKEQLDSTYSRIDNLVELEVMDTLNVTHKATAPTMPVGTNTTDVATMAALQAQIAATQYVFTVTMDGGSISSPTDATAYYLGVPLGLSSTAGSGNRQETLPFACTLIGYSITIYAGTAGTNETYSIYVRKNDSTDNSIGSSFMSSTVNGISKYFSANNLNVSYAAGDKIEIKVVTPTWATNPASLVHHVTLYFKTTKA